MMKKVKMSVIGVAAVVCLPYDLSLPHHGFYIRIVDEDGNPIPGARISGDIVNDDDSHLMSTTDLSGTTDENGEFYVGRLFKCKGAMRADRISINHTY